MITVTVLKAAAAVAAAGAIAIAGAPAASAADSYPNVEGFGTPEELVDGAHTIIQGWAVTDLQPSTDHVAWPVHGRLWQATATVRAVRGTVTPIISDFNARAADGQDYQELALVSTAQGISPSTIAQGGQSTGKLYFDVVGPPPNSVVYNAGGRDLLFWVR